MEVHLLQLVELAQAAARYVHGARVLGREHRRVAIVGDVVVDEAVVVDEHERLVRDRGRDPLVSVQDVDGTLLRAVPAEPGPTVAFIIRILPAAGRSKYKDGCEDDAGDAGGHGEGAWRHPGAGPEAASRAEGLVVGRPGGLHRLGVEVEVALLS